MISGEKKLGSIACPEPWKYGSRSAVGMYVVTIYVAARCEILRVS